MANATPGGPDASVLPPGKFSATFLLLTYLCTTTTAVTSHAIIIARRVLQCCPVCSTLRQLNSLFNVFVALDRSSLIPIW